MTYAVIDIETTTKTTYKRKANPFDPDNWMVLCGYKKKGDMLPTAVRLTRQTQDHEWLVHVLGMESLQLLVGVNIKFDLLHALRCPLAYTKWQQFVARGGVVWDCQLAEYLLDGQAQSSHMLSLDDMSIRYGGDTKIDEVKALWEAGVSTEDIDPDLLMRYLVGETLPNGERREGDIGNTELVFLKQLEKARNSGQVRSIMLNMGSLCATIEMERNGMYVNKALGLTLAAELADKLEAATGRLNEYLPELPFDFSWTNRFHLSPLVFGGQVKYMRREYDHKDGSVTWTPPPAVGGSTYAYAQTEVYHYILEDGRTMECSWYEHICHTEWAIPGNRGEYDYATTYKSGKNAGEFKTKKVKVDDYNKPKSRMAECFWDFAGYTEPSAAWESETPGLYSVAADVIDSLGNRNIPFLKDLAAVKKMDKDLGTYFVRYDPKKEVHVGMLTLVQPDSIIHHSLNHTSTVTGRFSSSNPNLQNIPKGNKSTVKQVFESRFGAEGVIIQSDFSSLEVYIQAILTHCSNLILDLKAGIDLHCMRLSLKEHMEYAEVFALCKGDNAQPEWDVKRTGSKEFSFQRAYGAGAKAISDSTGLPLEEVNALILAEDTRYPEIGAYCAGRIEEVKVNRRPTNRVVPHPKFPTVMCQLGISRLSTPDNKRYTYSESPSMEHDVRRGITASFMPTEVKNYEFQGTGGEWMKAAMWLAVRYFYANNNFDGKALLVNTVHDAQYADTDGSVRVRVGTVLQGCMEAASDFMEWWFTWPLPLPVPTDTVWGVNMGEEKKFTETEFKAQSSEVRQWLRRNYMANYVPSYSKESV